MFNLREMHRKITVQRASRADDGFTSEIQSWSDFVTLWAMRRDVSDGEKFSAGQVGSKLQSRFTVHSTSDARTITPQDRLTHDGATWEILGVKEAAEGRNRLIEITAVRDGD